MKILLTADWHIKLGQKGVPKHWARNRYYSFFEQVHEIEDKVDLHVAPGDIFDKLPSMEELELFLDFVAGVKVRTLISTGNHEATKKGESFLSFLKKGVNRINPLVHIIDEIYEEDSFTIVPYEFIHKKATWDNLDKNKAVFSHIRGEIPPHVTPEIDLNWVKDFPVIFLGDLHSHSNCQGNLVYPGSPMTTSFHRNEVDTGYIIIDDNDYSWTWHKFELPQLIRKTVTKQEDMVATPYHHTVYEIEGDVVDLGKIKATDLLDKKITKRRSDTALILENGMSIQDELAEYLRYILELEEDKVKKVLEKFNDYAAKA